MTPLLQFDTGLFAKAEHFQPGGSHKARAARMVVLRAERAGLIKPNCGHTILEKSGGNFAVCLCAAGGSRYRYNFLVRPSFSLARRRQLERLGAKLVGIEAMRRGASNTEIIDEELASGRASGKVVYFPDQFKNEACVEGHLAGADELVSQLRGIGMVDQRPLTFVCAAGTGAHQAAYAQVLRAAFSQTRICLAEPEGCDWRNGKFSTHAIQGVAVGTQPPLIAADCIDMTIRVPDRHALAAADHMWKSHGVFVGPSSGLVHAAASAIVRRPEELVVHLTYDSGEAYFADSIMAVAA